MYPRVQLLLSDFFSLCHLAFAPSLLVCPFGKAHIQFFRNKRKLIPYMIVTFKGRGQLEVTTNCWAAHCGTSPFPYFIWNGSWRELSRVLFFSPCGRDINKNRERERERGERNLHESCKLSPTMQKKLSSLHYPSIQLTFVIKSRSHISIPH
jgi:hypothetical protein